MASASSKPLQSFRVLWKAPIALQSFQERPGAVQRFGAGGSRLTYEVAGSRGLVLAKPRAGKEVPRGGSPRCSGTLPGVLQSSPGSR
eukprot:4944069-Alexandrium_andersonii.AAC.1